MTIERAIPAKGWIVFNSFREAVTQNSTLMPQNRPFMFFTTGWKILTHIPNWKYKLKEKLKTRDNSMVGVGICSHSHVPTPIMKHSLTGPTLRTLSTTRQFNNDTPEKTMKPFLLSHLHRSCLAAALTALALAGMPLTGAAANYFYDTTTTGTWATGGGWSDNLYLGGTTGTPPGSSDKAFFNQFGITAASTTVNLDADTSVGGLTFYNTSTATIIQSPTVNKLLNIGSGGVYINSGAAAVSFGDSGFVNFLNYVGLDVGNQSWVNNASTTFTLNSNVKAVNANRALTIGGTGATTFLIGLQNGSFSTSLIKDGSGVLTFTDATTGTGAKFTFNGGLTLNAGKVLLNSTASGSSGFADIIGESALTMAGGTLVATWANTVTSLSNQQTVNGTTLNAGAAAIGANNSQGTASTTKNAYITLGAVTRNQGSTVNFSATGNATAADRIFVQSSSWTAGVAGTIVSDSGVTYATAVGSTTSSTSPSTTADNWAGTDAGNKICNSAYAATYTASTATTLTGNADVNSATDTTLGANASPTSLRFSHASARTITATGYTLTTGGILISSAVGANVSKITGGTLRSAATAANKDLVIINNDSSSYLDLTGTTIADSGAGATGLTLSGTGGLALGSANTYSGPTYINGGYISFGSDGTTASTGYPLGYYPGSVVPGAIYLNGGILNATAGLSIGANRGFTLGGNGGTINSASSSTLTINSVITSATGATSPQGYDLLGINNGTTQGTVTLANANTFTGGVKINSGELKLAASTPGALNSTAGSENSVDMNAAGTAAASALTGAGSVLTLNGNSVTIADLKTTGTAAAYPAVVQNANASAATLTIGNSQNLSGSTFSGVIQDGTGGAAVALVKTGVGTLTLSPSIVRACSWTAAAQGADSTVTVTSGDVSYLQASVALSGITGATTIKAVGTGNFTTTAGSGGISAGSGNVTFSQRLNTYTGGTIVKNGTLSVGSTALPYNSALTLGDSSANTPGVLNLVGSQTLSTLNSAGTAGLNNLVRAGASAYGLTLTGGNQTFNGTFGSASDAMNLTYSGSGTLSLGGRINYTGTTTIGAGSTISLTSANVLGTSGTATTTFKNQNTAGTYTLQYAAGATLNANAVVDFSVNATPATTFAVNLDGYSQTFASLNLGQKNTMTVTSSSGTPTLTVSGNTSIGSANSASVSETIAPSSGCSLILGAVTAPQPTGGGNRVNTLVLDGTTSGNQITGIISDAPAFGTTNAQTAITKQNTSTWTLAGTNTYTGITTVSVGTLKIVKTNSLYNADNTKWNPTYIAVASGATLALNVGGTGEFDSTMLTTFLDGSHMGLSTMTTGFKTGSGLALDTSNAGGSFTGIALGNLGGVNGLTKLGTGALVLNGANTYTGPTYIYGGTLKLTGGSLGNTAITNFGGTLAIQPGGNTTINIGSTATASAGANLNLGSGTFDMTDGAVSTCNIQQGSSFTTPALTVSNNATFKFNLGNSSADRLILVNGAGYGVASVSGTVNVTIDTTGATSLTVGTYPLITAASGLTAGSPAPTWQFTGGGTAEHVTVNGTVYNLKLQATDTAINLTVENTYSVTYNGNVNDGGSVPTDNTAYNNGQTVTVLGNTGGLTKSGSVFNGWNTAADGSGLPTGSTYQAGNTFSISANVTLYAQWQGASGTISTSGSPSAMTTTYGTASAPTSFSVSGSGLDNNGIVVTAPSGFEVSLSSGGAYSGSVTVGAGSGTVASTPVYVRLKASNAIGSYSGNLQCQNALASLVNVAIPSSAVNQAPLNLTATSAQSKMYDGTTTTTVNGTLNGVLAGDVGNVSLSTSDNFPVATANNTTPQTWTPNWTLTGSAAAKYQITNSPLPTVTASILSAGIWTNTVSGNWGAAANWTNNIIATNVSNTADFSQVDITSDATVTLETAKTIGNLIFGDKDTSSPAGWTIAGATTLTLAGTTPTVTVNALTTGKSATLGTVIAGSSGLTKAGSGTLTLTNANIYTGGTTLNAGTVSIGNANALGTSGTIDFSGGSTLQWGSGITADLSARLKIEDGVTATLDTGNNTLVAATALTVGSSGTGALIKQGSGTLTLSGANTFSGGVTLANGQLNVNNAGSGGTSSAIGTGTLTINGGTTIDNTSGADLGLSTANPVSLAGDFTYTGSKSLAFGAGGVTLTGGSRTLTVNGSSTYLALAGPIGDGGNHYGLTKGGSSTSTLYLLATNTYSGPTVLNAGTLSVGSSTANSDLGSSPSVTINGGTLQFVRSTDYTYNGTITGASAGTVVRLSSSPGQLSLGTVSGISTLNDSYASGVANNKPLILNQSGTGLTISTVTGASGSFVQFAGDGTGNTTISSVPATAGQLLDVESGTLTLGYGGSQHAKNNIKVGGGTLTLGSSADRFAPDAGGTSAQTLSISGSGTFTVPNSAGFGARLGGYNGPGGSGGANFTGTQNGGTFNVLHGGSQQSFCLGANAASAGTVCQYTLSGGTLNIIGTGANGYLEIGADTTGNCTSSLALSGGKLIVSSTIQGYQAYTTPGPIQNFVFTGGILAANNINMTKLITSGNITANPGTLANSGTGTLAPGDIGYPGKTTITGSYSDNVNATNAFDLGGSTAASVFQDGTSNSYDNVSISGTATLAGNLVVNLLNNFDPSGQSFTIITNTSSGISGGFANVVNGRVAVANRAGMSFRVIVSANTVVLDNYASLVWNGNLGSDWNTANNWTNPVTASAATYADPAAVLFDDTAATANVTLNSTVNPTNVSFNHATLNYVLSGTGKISGSATVNKSGTGTTTLGTANDYTGLTTVSKGVLLITNASALGSVTAGTVVASGAALQLANNITTLAEPLTLNGTGIAADGALRSTSGNNNYTGSIIFGINGSAGRIAADAGTLTLSSATPLTGNNVLFLSGAGSVIVNSPIQITGAYGVQISSATGGSATLNTSNSFSGGVTLNTSALLNIGNSYALGTNALVIGGNGSFDNTSGSPMVISNALTISGGSPTFVGSANLTISGAATITGATTRTITVTAGNLTLAGGLGDSGQGRNLTKAGNGTLILSGGGTYTGATTVSAGELVGYSGGSLTSPVTVASGGTNGVLVQIAGGQWSCAGLTNRSGSALDFNFGGTVAPSTTTAPLVSGNLAITNPTIVVRNVSGTLAAGDYPLVKYTGTFSGTVAGGVTLSGVNLGGNSATIINNLANQSIDLVVASPTTGTGTGLAWAVGNGNWDFSTANWTNTSVSGNVAYSDGNAVIFDDTASGTSPIYVTNAVVASPASVTFNLTNKNYIFYTSGGNRITGGAGVTLNGSGTLTFAINNSYTGGTLINGGTLQLGDGAGTDGYISGNITNYAALVLNESSGHAVTYASVISGSGTLTVSAPGTNILTAASTYTGNTVINAGTLALSGSGSLASTNISVATNATFDVSGVTGGSYALNGAGMLTLAVAKSGATLSSGKVNATGITAGGTLSVTTSGDALADGDTFTLFNVQPSGTFSTPPTFASGGTNWWTTDNNKTIRYNLWPTAGIATYHHNKGMQQQFTVADLTNHVTGATSGKTITLTSVAGYTDLTTAQTLTSGATLQASGPLSSGSTLILYTPASTDNGDSLTYMVSDGRGGTPSGTVSLVADTGSVFGQQSPQMTADGSGHITIKFYGVPGYSYYVQRADDVNFSQNVTELGPYNATTGNPVISLTDNINPNGQAYYRLEWRP